MSTSVMQRKAERREKEFEDAEKEIEDLIKANTSETKEELPEDPTNENDPFQKRYGDLRRHSAKKEKELRDKISALEAKVASNTSQEKPPTSEEDMKVWMEKYPDVANVVKTIAMEEARKLTEGNQQKFAELDEVRYETKVAKAQNLIRKIHPDFDDLSNSDDFHDWAESKPQWVQDALFENPDDAEAVVEVINFYKSENKGKRKKKSDTSAAEEVPTTRQSPNVEVDGQYEFSESQIAAMSIKEYAEKEEAIEKALASGKVYLDITAGARM